MTTPLFESVPVVEVLVSPRDGAVYAAVDCPRCPEMHLHRLGDSRDHILVEGRPNAATPPCSPRPYLVTDEAEILYRGLHPHRASGRRPGSLHAF